MIGWICYGVLCALWGTFTARMQVKLRRDTSCWYNRPWMAALINAVGAPVSMVIAIVRVPVKATE